MALKIALPVIVELAVLIMKSASPTTLSRAFRKALILGFFFFGRGSERKIWAALEVQVLFLVKLYDQDIHSGDKSHIVGLLYYLLNSGREFLSKVASFFRVLYLKIKTMGKWIKKNSNLLTYFDIERRLFSFLSSDYKLRFL